MRMSAAGALACALALTAFATPASGQSRAVIAFLPKGPGETRPLLEEFAARGMAIGLTSPTVGGFKVRQMGLDMSQGARIPTRLYSGPIGSLRPLRGRLSGWGLALHRAAKAPADVKPGLLGSVVGRVGYAVHARGFSIAPVVAATRSGRVSPIRPGDLLDVIGLAPGAAGLRELDRLLARRGRGFVYVVRAPSGDRLRLLPSAVAAPGIRGRLRSATTRRDGLIAATDVAPSVLRFLRLRVPDAMQGQPIEGRGSADPKGLEVLAQRLSVVTGRRGVALEWLLAALLVAAALVRLADGRGAPAARIGLLALMWLPGLALLTAALEPGRTAEAVIVGVGAVILGLLTDRLVAWPVGPAIPAAVVFVAHAVDLARGSAWIGLSMAGPNPAGGARFFGIGNELEAMLSVSVLIGTGAALCAGGAGAATSRPLAAPRPAQSRQAPVAFAAVAFIAAVVMGAGRLGADVGAVITLGAGGAAAVVASLPSVPSRRVVALAVAVPVVAVAALALLDLATGGGAHLTRSVLHAHGSGDLLDVVRRRFAGSVSTLRNPWWALSCAFALVWMAWLAVAGRAPLRRRPQPFTAGLVGAWFASVVGALANDSGPLILDIGAVFLLFGYFYARAMPKPGETPRG